MNFTRARCVLLSALLLSGCDRTDRGAQVATVVKEELSGPSVAVPASQSADVRRFYEARAFRPAWTDGRDVKRAARALEILQSAKEHGLDPEDYDQAALTAAVQSAAGGSADAPGRARELADLDLRVSTVLLDFAHDVALGRVNPERIDRAWKAKRTAPDLPATLEASLDDLPGWIDRIQPQHPEYAALRRALATIASADGGAQTKKDASRAAQLALNLERWRWVPDDLGARHLIVNVPAFELRAREQGATVLKMRVIAGKADGHKTPIFSDVMETVVFSPYWNIPVGIGRDETLPGMLDEFSSLERNGIEILKPTKKGRVVVDPLSIDWYDEKEVRSLTFRQKPGPANALGKVKFLFPNEYDVYLHDTPADKLFDRTARDLSHGCVRVAEPETLARYVLRGETQWTNQRIAAAMDAGTERHVRLPERIPVHIVYFTAWPDESGTVHYEADVYRFDARQRAVLARTNKDS